MIYKDFLLAVRSAPNENDQFTQCRLNGGPSSTAMAQQ